MHFIAADTAWQLAHDERRERCRLDSARHPPPAPPPSRR